MSEVTKTCFGWQVVNAVLKKHITVKTKTRALELKQEMDKAEGELIAREIIEIQAKFDEIAAA